jgi:hypothetical protein
VDYICPLMQGELGSIYVVPFQIMYIYIYIYISKSRIVLRLLSLCDLVKSKEKIESKQYMHREFMWFHLRSTHSTYIAFILETNVTTSFRIRTTISNKIMLCMQAL